MKFRVVLILLALLLGCGNVLAGEAHVVAVADGDTFSVETTEGERFKVRIYGIDAPERDQDFGPEAGEYLADLILDRDVTVDDEDRDRYGRHVAMVFSANGTNVGEEMVSAGLAWWYRQYASNDRSLQNLEADARRGQRGLWSEDDPVPPWEHRASKRSTYGTK